MISDEPQVLTNHPLPSRQCPYSQGLRQIHDISGARVAAYTITAGSRDERHVSIRGTNVQIGDALVVLGKWLARKRVRNPKTKSKSSSTAAPPPSQAAAASAPPSVARGGGAASWSSLPAPSTSRNLGQPPGVVTLLPSTTPPAATPMSRSTSSTRAGLESLQPPPAPTVVMGSPSSSSTPSVPSVQMGSPSSIDSPGDLTPMQVDAVLLYHPNPPHELHLRQAVAFRIVQNEYDGVVPPGLIRQLSTSQSSRPQTARHGRGRGHRGA